MDGKNKMNFPVLLRDLATGAMIGVANIIPGVSGGTFLLVFGIYGRVMASLDTIHKGMIAELRNIAAAIPGALVKPENRSRICVWLTAHDFLFLSRLLLGAATAILILSGVMKYLLTNQFEPTHAFFFGLILVSIIIPFRLLQKWQAIHVVPLLAGLGLTIYVTNAVNPATRARTKSEYYAGQLADESNSQGPVRTYSVIDYTAGALSGACAVSAMALPGISGSLVLILLGQYYTVLSAISELKHFSLEAAAFLGVFSIGMLLGILLFAKLITWVLAHFHDVTMAFLTGLMGGSLWALWPFREKAVLDLYVKSGGTVAIVRDMVVHTNRNIFPSAEQLALPVIMFLLGCGVMSLFAFRREASGEQA
ncbi:MAG: DUF368 domain-containing protein [Chitinivibrionales bacterium]|nr:DUF368 domain-containing protein [Chitinivibrionales bacterium]